MAALDDDAPASSDGPPTTNAPSGAPIQQVEAGMREAEIMDQQQQRGRGQHPEGSPSSQDLRRGAREEAMLSHAAHSSGTG